ncbi:hypothetical protein L2E82_45699 [Cichorium intybus]|uniref:Uncharacterized protein n=1 Tax=Cichorium intybus TaxID=13427 RepID=A0ACB8ZU88_CICIN|nr:hypothetical protein L2E82_45699 [Cichorium intybus]
MSKPTATITVSPLKSAINATKSVCIKKRSREDACGNLEFSFTPKSVLQNGNVQHSSTSSNNHKNKHSVTESERCRRTDGKKWQCTKSAIQGQKYCAQHMHRGAKKVQNRQNFNTGLSFSVRVGYEHKGDIGNQPNESSSSDDDDDGNNSSSSDATTISM